MRQGEVEGRINEASELGIGFTRLPSNSPRLVAISAYSGSSADDAVTFNDTDMFSDVAQGATQWGE